MRYPTVRSYPHRSAPRSGVRGYPLGHLGPRVLGLRSVLATSEQISESGVVRCAESRAYRSYQPWRKARPRVQPHAWNISQAGVASLSISILSASRASAAKM